MKQVIVMLVTIAVAGLLLQYSIKEKNQWLEFVAYLIDIAGLIYFLYIIKTKKNEVDS